MTGQRGLRRRRAGRRPAGRHRRRRDGRGGRRERRGRHRRAGRPLRRHALARARNARPTRRARGWRCGAAAAADAWYVAQALIAAEAVGTVQTTLEMSVQYAKERFTFGRAIGSYQAVKHELTEVLRRLENGRSLLFYAGLVARRRARRVPARGERRAVGGRRRAGLRRALEHQRARRHRRDVGARRPAVLPPRPADPPPHRRPRRRDRSRGRAASRSLSAETNRAGGKALPTSAAGCYGARHQANSYKYVGEQDLWRRAL